MRSYFAYLIKQKQQSSETATRPDPIPSASLDEAAGGAAGAAVERDAHAHLEPPAGRPGEAGR